MKIEFREQALQDIEVIHSYFAKQDSEAALNIVWAIYAGIRFITGQPYASALTDDKEVRFKNVRKYHYKIFYSIKSPDVLEVLHIRHTSRDLWKKE